MPQTTRTLAPLASTEWRGGAASAVVSLGVLLPLGLLAFAPLGPAYASVGIHAAFAAAIVGGLIAALVGGSEVPGTGPRTSPCLIYAGFVAVLARDPRLATPAGLDVDTLVLVASLPVVLAGALQCAFGLLRLGSLASFVPLPVVAGFMDGVAVLIAISQLKILFGYASGDGGHAQWGSALLGLATAAVCWTMARRLPRVPWALVGIVAGSLAYAAAGALFPSAALGPVLGGSAPGIPQPIALAPLVSDPVLALVVAHWPDLVTTAVLIALIGGLDTLLSAAGVDAQFHGHHDPNRLLLGHGLGNVASAFFGGIPVAGSSVLQLAARRAGARTRNAALLSSLGLLLILLVAGSALGRIPMAVTAGVMLVVALGMFDQWSRGLWWRVRGGSRDRDVLWSLVIVLSVGVITVVFGFVAGIGIGVVLSVALFVTTLNRSLVRSVSSGEVRGSRRIYDPERARLLREHGAQIRLVELEGPIFFGSARRLGPEMEALAEGARFVIVDVRRVTLIDASGAHSLERLATRLDRKGVRLLLAGLEEGDRHARPLRAYGAGLGGLTQHWFADTDRALEHAERRLLEAAGARAPDIELPLERLSLLRDMTAGQSETLRGMLARIELAAGDVLFRRGEPGDRLYVLAKGSVSILVDVDEGVEAAHRLASFAPGVVFGETAMLDGGGRTAGAAADEPSVVYVLTRADFDAIRASDPALAGALLFNIARELSGRLRFATATIQAAER